MHFVKGGESCSVNFHAPPYGTSLDLPPKLKPDLTPVMGPGGTEMVHVGNRAVAEAIRRYRPVIGLHGHMHESAASRPH